MRHLKMTFINEVRGILRLTWRRIAKRARCWLGVNSTYSLACSRSYRGPSRNWFRDQPNQPLITPFAAIAEGKITSSIVGMRVDRLPAGVKRTFQRDVMIVRRRSNRLLTNHSAFTRILRAFSQRKNDFTCELAQN